MKPLFSLFLALVLYTTNTVHAQTGTPPTGPLPIIELDPILLVDTIRLDSGDRNSSHFYHLRNTGNAPLIITGVRSSDPCFCSEWPKEPIAAGTAVQLKVSCPRMYGPGPRKQTFFISSNAGQDVMFKLERFGVGSRVQAPGEPLR